MFTWVTLILLAVIAVILVIKGTTPADPVNPLADKSVPKNSTITDFEKQIWLKPNPKIVRKIQRGLVLAGILIAIIAAAFFYIGFTVSAEFLDREFALQGIAMIAIYFAFVWISRVNLGTTIGLHRDRITLRDHSGREVKHAIGDTIYDGRMIATPDMAIALGNEQIPFYDKEAIAAVLLPRLNESQEVSVLAMQAALIRMRHPLGILNVVGLLMIAGFLAWMLFDAYI
jgi:hypothetical protein